MDQPIIATKNAVCFFKQDCLACERHGYPPCLPWVGAFEPLLTCKQVYNEASHILKSSLTLHVGGGSDDMPCLNVPPPKLNGNVGRLELWAHIQEKNRMQWRTGIQTLATSFSNLQELIIHAHMRPLDDNHKLVDSIAIAVPVVRLRRDKPDIKVTIDFSYTFKKCVLDNPFLHHITTEDSLDHHELVLRDLIEDGDFVAAALAEEEDEYAYLRALLRISRIHQQSWFDKIRSKMFAGLEMKLAAEAEGTGPQASSG